MSTYHIEKDDDGFPVPIPTGTPFNGENVILSKRAVPWGSEEYGYYRINIEGYRVGDKVYAMKLKTPRLILNAPVKGRKEKYPGSRRKLLVGVGSDRPAEEYPHDHTEEMKWFKGFIDAMDTWITEYLSGGRITEMEVTQPNGATRLARVFEEVEGGKFRLEDYFPDWANDWTPEHTAKNYTNTITKRAANYKDKATGLSEGCTFYSLSVVEGRPFHLYLDPATVELFERDEDLRTEELPGNFLDLKSNSEKGMTFLDMEVSFPAFNLKKSKPYKMVVEANAIQYSFTKKGTSQIEGSEMAQPQTNIRKRCNPFDNAVNGDKIAKATA